MIQNERVQKMHKFKYFLTIKQKTMTTYFFAQDQDCHWYQIPSSLRGKWNEFTANDMDDQDEIDKFDEIFAVYRTGGGISDIDFTPIVMDGNTDGRC